MRLTMNKKELTAALALLTKVADAKSTMPILACVRIGGAAGDETAELTATDLSTTARVRVPATIAQGGVIAADARQLVALVKAAAGETVALEEEGASLRVGAAAMPTMHAPDLPRLPAASDEVYPWVAPAEWSRLMAKALPVVSLDETRYHLCGVNVEADAKAGELRIVATDGHRMAKMVCAPVAFGHKNTVTGIVPRQSAQLIASACKRASSFRCAIVDGYFHAEIDGATFAVQLINAQFPSYDAVIPKKDAESRTLAVGRDALAGELKKARDILRAADRRAYPHVVMGMRAGKVRIVAHGHDSDAVVYSGEVAGTYAGPSQSFAIGFDADYMLAALAALDEETAHLDFSDAADGKLDPIGLRSSDGALTYVVMPCRAAGRYASAVPDADEAPAQEQPQPAKVQRTRVAKVKAQPAPVTIVEPVTDAAPAPVRALVEEANPEHLLTATVEVAAGIVDAFMAFALRAAADAATAAARACYRCKEVRPMGYILDGKVCCRDCREAHRVDYYAGRGQVAQPRQRRQRGVEVVQTVAALHVRAEHVTVEPATTGHA
jgi:DNA polymerase-3 subunit beta